MNKIINKEIRMTSVEVCELINQFRELEENKSELQHKHLLDKIRKELGVLESLGLKGLPNFQPSSYVNSQKKEQPCFSLNRDGVLQICASESALVRYKIVEYINKLEEVIKKQQGKANLLLLIYDGGQDAILASKKLVELETKPLIETIEKQQPKVEFAEKMLKTKDNILVREYAKFLCDKGFKTGEKRLFKWLKDNKYLMKNNEPYQHYVNNNTFVVVVNTVNGTFGDIQTRTTKITPQGQLYLYEKIKKDENFSK